MVHLFSDVGRGVGFSAVLHGLFILAIYHTRAPMWLRIWFLIVIVGKVTAEQAGVSLTALSGILTSNGGRIGYDAHFYGLITGVVLVLLTYAVNFKYKSTSTRSLIL